MKQVAPQNQGVSINGKYFEQNVSISEQLVSIENSVVNNSENSVVDEVSKEKKYMCICGKCYKHRQSLYNHRKSCTLYLNDVNDENKIIPAVPSDVDKLTALMTEMIKDNREMRKCISEIVPKIGNTIIHHNNQFNMNVFLNEHCKNAQSLSDFIKTIRPCIEDLHKTKDQGYVAGLSNIFIRNLKQLDTHERPIHCSDLKRQTMYVKDDEGWEVDNERKTIKKAISEVAKKQIGLIKKWEEQHPDWNTSESQTEEYMNLIRNLTDAGDNPETIEQTENKIIKTIAKEVVIDK